MPHTLDVCARQALLKDLYRADSPSALVISAARRARSHLSRPRHCAVAPVDVSASFDLG